MGNGSVLPPGQLAQLVLYEGPKPIAPSETARMWADGNELFVYDTAVNNTHTWDSRYNPPLSTAQIASFDFANGDVELKVALSTGEDLGEVTVRPLSYGIEPQVEGNTLRFRISQPDVYTVEYQGSSSKAMHIFANAIDEDAPTESTDTVKYIGPGAWIADTMVLEDGMDVYISGGAVIRGTLIGNKVHDATVRGHGFFDGSNNKSWMLNKMTAYIPVSLRESQNVSVSGIGILNPNDWCVELYSCDNVDISGLKIISARPNGDGISVQSCRNVTVRDSFIRTWDDSLVVKNYSNRKGSDSADILFDGCQLWTDLAQSMEIGYETNKGGKLRPTIQNVAFSNITVLHNFHKPVMSIHNADDAEVSGILFRDITVDLEEPQKISGFGILLNPRQIWNARTQDVEIQTSDDGEEFATLLPAQTVEFDPMTDNRCYLPLDESVQARYVRFVFTANSGADAGQAAEIEVYKAQ